MLKFGCHVGGDSSGLEQVDWCVQNGFDCVQFFTGDPSRVEFTKPPNALFDYGRKVGCVIHSPYWVSLFNPRMVELQVGYIKFLSAFYASKLDFLWYVTHTGSPLEGADWASMKEAYKSFCGKLVAKKAVRNMMVCVENSAGHRNRLNYTAEQLCELAETNPDFMGVTLDTEHLYAAGEPFSAVPWEKVTIIHLNAIPLYVRFGGTLDRHSLTLIKDGKQDVQEVLTMLKQGKFKGGPVVFERRDQNLSKIDLDYTKAILDA